MIKFHLPGLRYNFPLNMLVAGMMKNEPELFRDDIAIGSFFGEFPLTLWSGGRYAGDDQCGADFVRHVIASINGAGIPIRYTYTNPTLTERDLDDPYGNFCLREGSHYPNEVLVVAPCLEAYIRKNYPSYAICSSTCKEIRDVESLSAELDKDYKLVVLDYNMNNQWDILEHLKHREKVEILINACCIPNCPRRGEHYRCIGEDERTTLNNRKLPPDKRKPIRGWTCPQANENSLYKIQDYPTFVSADAIWERYVPMGYENFKIEGRTANMLVLADTYAYYLMKPTRRDEGRMLLLAGLQQAGVVGVRQPKKEIWREGEAAQ